MNEKKLVVIIDDEEDLCMLLRTYFKNKDYSVHCFHTLDTGLSAIFDLAPDVLFLDNNLPDGLGWDAAPQLAKNFPEMFINFISGYHPSVPAMPADALFQVIDKPFSFRKLDALNI